MELDDLLTIVHLYTFVNHRSLPPRSGRLGGGQREATGRRRYPYRPVASRVRGTGEDDDRSHRGSEEGGDGERRAGTGEEDKGGGGLPEQPPPRPGTSTSRRAEQAELHLHHLIRSQWPLLSPPIVLKASIRESELSEPGGM
jgi:hypothetical protein